MKPKKPKKNQNNLILALQEIDIATSGGEEVGGAEVSSQRSQRQRRLTSKFNNCEIDIA